MVHGLVSSLTRLQMDMSRGKNHPEEAEEAKVDVSRGWIDKQQISAWFEDVQLIRNAATVAIYLLSHLVNCPRELTLFDYLSFRCLRT